MVCEHVYMNISLLPPPPIIELATALELNHHRVHLEGKRSYKKFLSFATALPLSVTFCVGICCAHVHAKYAMKSFYQDILLFNPGERGGQGGGKIPGALTG